MFSMFQSLRFVGNLAHIVLGNCLEVLTSVEMHSERLLHGADGSRARVLIIKVEYESVSRSQIPHALSTLLEFLHTGPNSGRIAYVQWTETVHRPVVYHSRRG
jgi:hypothetical protein